MKKIPYWFSLALTLAHGNYRDMENEENRGKTFRWCKFPGFVYRQAWVDCYVYKKSTVYLFFFKPLIAKTARLLAFILAYKHIQDEEAGRT